MGSFGQIWAQPQTPNDAQFCPIVHNWGRKILEARFRRPQPALVVRRILTPMNWVPLTTTRRWRAKRAPPRYNLERSEGTRTTMSQPRWPSWWGRPPGLRGSSRTRFSAQLPPLRQQPHGNLRGRDALHHDPRRQVEVPRID